MTRFVGCGVACGLLAACAPPLRDPWGLAVSRGEFPADTTTAAPTAPLDVQADLGILAHSPGSIPVSSRLYARPGRHYRLDVFGLLTPVAATWLWTAHPVSRSEVGQDGEVARGGSWVLVRHDTRQIVFGSGVNLDDPAFPLIIPDVHAVLGPVWGALLPGFPGEATTLRNDSVFWMQGDLAWHARFDKSSGFCLEATSAAMSLRYAKYSRVDQTGSGGARVERALPRSIEVHGRDGLVLSLEIRNRIERPAWSKDPFDLKLPDDYETLRVNR